MNVSDNNADDQQRKLLLVPKRRPRRLPRSRTLNAVSVKPRSALLPSSPNKRLLVPRSVQRLKKPLASRWLVKKRPRGDGWSVAEAVVHHHLVPHPLVTSLQVPATDPLEPLVPRLLPPPLPQPPLLQVVVGVRSWLLRKQLRPLAVHRPLPRSPLPASTGLVAVVPLGLEVTGRDGRRTCIDRHVKTTTASRDIHFTVFGAPRCHLL